MYKWINATALLQIQFGFILKISICILNTLIIDAICISSVRRNLLDKLYSVTEHLRHLSLSLFHRRCVISSNVGPVVDLCKRSDSRSDGAV